MGLTKNETARGQRTQVDNRVRPNYSQALVGVARQRKVQMPVGNKCCRVCAVQRRVDSQCRKSVLAADYVRLFTHTGWYEGNKTILCTSTCSISSYGGSSLRRALHIAPMHTAMH